MDQGNQIVDQVCAAKTDTEAADGLIRQYMGFIRSETAKFIHRIPQEGRDDELSIAMLAFHEAVMSYEKTRGAFMKYAARVIRNRLIDYYRAEKRHRGNVSLNRPAGEEEEEEFVDKIADETNRADESVLRGAAREEILEFGRQLEDFGISYSEVADNCPKQKRTLYACQKVLTYAREHPALLDEFLRTKKVPMAEAARETGVERKTLERHRKYLVAILLAMTNGYEIIRGHLYQIIPRKGGEEV